MLARTGSKGPWQLSGLPNQMEALALRPALQSTFRFTGPIFYQVLIYDHLKK